MSSIFKKITDYLFSSLQIIYLVIFLLASNKVKKMYIIFVFILFTLFFFICFLHSKISLGNILSDAVSNTVAYHKEKLNIMDKNINNAFNLEIKNIENDNPYFSSLTLYNNKQKKHIQADINNLTINDKHKLNCNLYIKNDKLGICFQNSNNLCYTAKSKKFCTRWNNSIYGSFLKIPSFVPDNLSYKKLMNLFSSKNFIKTAVALGIGNIDLSYNEFLKNIDIEDMGTYPLIKNNTQYDGRIVRVKIDNNYIHKITKTLTKSSSKAYIKDISYIFSDLEKLIKSSLDKYTIIDFVIYNDMIYSAETSFENPNSCINIKLSTTKSKISVSVSDIKRKQVSKLNLLMIYPDNNNTKLIISKTGKTILTADLFKNKEATKLSATFSSDKYGTSGYYIVLSENKTAAKLPKKEKSIYLISIADLYGIIKNFNI